MIVIGGGANRPGQALGLSAAIRQLGIPFFNTQMGKGAINGNSDLYIGTAALSTGDYVHLAVERADLIGAVGHDTAEKPPFLMRPGGPVVIHVDFKNPDFVQYARAYGAIGVRIASADGLIPALEMAFEEGGVHLVVAAIDYSENHRVFVDELNSKKANVMRATSASRRNGSLFTRSCLMIL